MTWKSSGAKLSGLKRGSASGVWLPNYGDGSDGAVTVSANNDWKTLWNKQTLQASNFTLDSGITLTLVTDYKPHVLRATGTVTINGTINGDGLGHAGGSGAVGNGGQSRRGAHGSGPGAGHGGSYSGSYGTGAGGAGHGAAGSNGDVDGEWGSGGIAHDPLGLLISGLINQDACGSGGGGGGSGTNGYSGGNGGNGGAGLWIVARTIVIDSAASITMDGANGSNAPSAGGGGGGSGGFLGLLAESITLPGSGTVITATGGTGGSGGYNGGAGAVGRIYLCCLGSLSPSDATSRSNPTGVVLRLTPLVNLA